MRRLAISIIQMYDRELWFVLTINISVICYMQVIIFCIIKCPFRFVFHTVYFWLICFMPSICLCICFQRHVLNRSQLVTWIHLWNWILLRCALVLTARTLPRPPWACLFSFMLSSNTFSGVNWGGLIFSIGRLDCHVLECQLVVD